MNAKINTKDLSPIGAAKALIGLGNEAKGYGWNWVSNKAFAVILALSEKHPELAHQGLFWEMECDVEDDGDYHDLLVVCCGNERLCIPDALIDWSVAGHAVSRYEIVDRGIHNRERKSAEPVNFREDAERLINRIALALYINPIHASSFIFSDEFAFSDEM